MAADFFRTRLVLSVYCSLLAIILIAFYSSVRIGLDQHFTEIIKVIGLSFFVLNLPIRITQTKLSVTQNKLLREEYFWILACLILVTLSGFALTGSGYLFAGAGFGFFIWNIADYFRQVRPSEVLNILLTCVVGVWLAVTIWDGDNLHPMLLERLPFDARLHIDTIFHTSVIQMIKTYGIASTGLNGLPILHYHVGSHYLFAGLSKAVNVHAFTFLQLGYPVIFLPLFIKVLVGLRVTWFEHYLHQAAKFDLMFWLVLLAGLIGILPVYFVLAKAGIEIPPAFASESYCISIILTLISGIVALSGVIHHGDQREFQLSGSSIAFLVAMAFVIGITKNSTLFVIDTFLGFCFIWLRLYRYRQAWFIYVLVGAVSILCTMLTLSSQAGSVSFFHFFRNHTQVSPLLAAVILFQWPIFLTVLCTVIKKGSKDSFEKKSIQFLQLSIVVISIAGSIPAMIWEIAGNSAVFFVNLQMWISVACLLAVAPRGFDRFTGLATRMAGERKVVVSVVNIIAFIALCSILTYNFGRVSGTFLQHTLEDRARICNEVANQPGIFTIPGEILKYNNRIQNCLEQNEIYRTLRSLEQLDAKLDVDKSILLLEPGDISNLKNAFPCYKYPFLFPALTGVALINGFTFESCHGVNYGFEDYSVEALARNGPRKKLKTGIINTSGTVWIEWVQ